MQPLSILSYTKNLSEYNRQARLYNLGLTCNDPWNQALCLSTQIEIVINLLVTYVANARNASVACNTLEVS